MADITPPAPRRLPALWSRIDKVWLVALLLPVAVALLDSAQLLPVLEITARNFGNTGIFIVIAITLVAYVKATGRRRCWPKRLRAINAR